MHVIRLDREGRSLRVMGAILATAWLSSASAHAGVITHHAVASAYSGAGDQADRRTEEGQVSAFAATAATLGPYGTDRDPYSHAESWGAAGGSFASLLRAGAASWNRVRFAGCVASGGAEWRDLASTQVVMVDPLRFHFEVTGTIDGLTTDGLELVTIYDPNAKADPVLAKITAYHENSAFAGSPSRVDVTGWDHFEVLGGAFHGAFHLDVPYDAGWGGYLWGVKLSVEAWTPAPVNGPIAISAVDMGHSLSLTGVTDHDDHPVTVTFDSGLSLSAVPEPSTNILLSLGAMGLAIAARRQRATVQH